MKEGYINPANKYLRERGLYAKPSKQGYEIRSEKTRKLVLPVVWDEVAIDGHLTIPMVLEFLKKNLPDDLR